MHRKKVLKAEVTCPFRHNPPVILKAIAAGLVLALVLITALPAFGATILQIADGVSAAVPGDVVTVHTAWSQDRARPGDRLLLAVVADIRKGFHLNADSGQVQESGDFKPIPTRVRVLEADEGITVAPARFPPAHPLKMPFAPLPLMFFDARVVILLPVAVAPGLPPGTLGLRVELSYQACDDQTCLFPSRVVLDERIRIAAAGDPEPVTRINRDLFAEDSAGPQPGPSEAVDFDLFGWTFSLDTTSFLGMGLLLVTAALGGMLLNFTPCVLPLVPIKIISLSNAAQQDRARSVWLGLFMFLGVLFFWLILGSLISAVSGFTATNQLFQYPVFTITVGGIIAVMALGMCGLFHTRLPGFIYGFNPDQENLPGSFAVGILTAVLSTPCTAPFMGAAAAWAATQPPATTLSVFAAIGIGMALPYLVLSAWPALVRFLPRSGPGSVLLKQTMGLFMLAASAYFIGGGLSALMTVPPDPPGKLYWWGVAAFCAAAGGWLAVRILPIAPGRRLRWIFAAIGLLMVAGSVAAGLRLTDKGPVDWVYYTPRRFESAVSNRKTVVMVFTAEWCLNCKALEQSVLHSRRISALLSAEEIVPMKVDITGNNPAGTAKLREVGSLTIPLLVVFSPDGKIVFKSDFYTTDQIVAVVEGIGRQGIPGN